MLMAGRSRLHMRLLCASVCVCVCVCVGETANTREELDKFYFVSLSFYVRFTPAAWKQLCAVARSACHVRQE